jgi:hypothetical protein
VHSDADISLGGGAKSELSDTKTVADPPDPRSAFATTSHPCKIRLRLTEGEPGRINASVHQFVLCRLCIVHASGFPVC